MARTRNSHPPAESLQPRDLNGNDVVGVLAAERRQAHTLMRLFYDYGLYTFNDCVNCRLTYPLDVLLYVLLLFVISSALVLLFLRTFESLQLK